MSVTNERNDTVRRRPLLARVAATAALAATSLFLTLGALELGLRLAGYEAIYDVYSKPSLFWRHDDVLGWSHEPGVSGVFVGPRPWPVEFRAPVRINALGMRGPELEDLPEGGVRILVMGDSLVAAFEVAYEDTFVARTQKLLEQRFDFPVQVLNAGVRGYGTDQSYLLYRERLWRLHPDIVLFYHSGNDPRNNVTLHRMRRPFGKPALVPEPGGGLRATGSPVPIYPLCASVKLDATFTPVRTDTALSRAACGLQVRLADHSALFTWITMRIRRNPGLLERLYGLGSQDETAALGPGPVRAAGFGVPLLAATGVEGAGEPEAGHDEIQWKVTAAILDAFHRRVTADGASFVLLIRPRHWERMRLDRYGIDARYIDLESQFTGMATRPYIRFQNDAHLNETGHELFAKQLAQLLAEVIEQRRAAGPKTAG